MEARFADNRKDATMQDELLNLAMERLSVALEIAPADLVEYIVADWLARHRAADIVFPDRPLDLSEFAEDENGLIRGQDRLDYLTNMHTDRLIANENHS